MVSNDFFEAGKGRAMLGSGVAWPLRMPRSSISDTCSGTCVYGKTLRIRLAAAFSRLLIFGLGGSRRKICKPAADLRGSKEDL